MGLRPGSLAGLIALADAGHACVAGRKAEERLTSMEKGDAPMFIHSTCISDRQNPPL